MDFEERLAKAILRTQELREESFDHVEADKYEANHKFLSVFDFEKCYKLSEYDAADKAAEFFGFDKRMTQPIYLLCKLAWNDIQDWAKEIKN